MVAPGISNYAIVLALALSSTAFLLATQQNPVTIVGKLEYQACDRKICFLPELLPVEWHVQALPLDRQRAPEKIRHK